MAFLAAQLEDLGEGVVDQREQQEQQWVDETSHALELMSATEHELARQFQRVADGDPLQVTELDLAITRMNSSLAKDPDALIGLALLRQHDHEGFDHSVNVSIYLMSMARAMDMDEQMINAVGLGGLLHDLGKSQIAETVLQKKDKLTEEDCRVIRQHVEASMSMMDVMEVSPLSRTLAVQHHERLDGSGYPHKLKGDAISQEGRMAAICDIFDAMTSNRIYRQARDGKEVLRYLLKESKESQRLDSRLVEIFIRAVGIYPVGSLVRLADQRMGVVVRNHRSDLLRPVVRIIYKGDIQVDPYTLDLAKHPESAAQRILGTESPSMTRLNPALYMPGPGCYQV
ncbi:metal dependent phosphohydrolase [Magnetococcus marinus MC-1]|uniref:Metal dependent phosphohydrolase n=2 Tax=Magnetococcus TaxID=162171 RepID=A0LCC1_MAGMM|nr:metal dependent phosphohydrolase [Magnetococcus marinus MC-1]